MAINSWMGLTTISLKLFIKKCFILSFKLLILKSKAILDNGFRFSKLIRDFRLLPICTKRGICWYLTASLQTSRISLSKYMNPINVLNASQVVSLMTTSLSVFSLEFSENIALNTLLFANRNPFTAGPLKQNECLKGFKSGVRDDDLIICGFFERSGKHCSEYSALKAEDLFECRHSLSVHYKHDITQRLIHEVIHFGIIDVISRLIRLIIERIQWK